MDSQVQNVMTNLANYIDSLVSMETCLLRHCVFVEGNLKFSWIRSDNNYNKLLEGLFIDHHSNTRCTQEVPRWLSNCVQYYSRHGIMTGSLDAFLSLCFPFTCCANKDHECLQYGALYQVVFIFYVWTAKLGTLLLGTILQYPDITKKH